MSSNADGDQCPGSLAVMLEVKIDFHVGTGESAATLVSGIEKPCLDDPLIDGGIREVLRMMSNPNDPVDKLGFVRFNGIVGTKPMTTKEAVIRCCVGTAMISLTEFYHQDPTSAVFHTVMYFFVGVGWWSFAVFSHLRLSDKTSN